MKHLTEEQIVMHYYGDADIPEDIREHLATCSSCRAEFSRLVGTLSQIETIAVPEPGKAFEQKIWLKLRDRLPEKKIHLWQALWAPKRWALGTAMAALVVAAFFAGRFTHPVAPVGFSGSVADEVGASDPKRLVLFAVQDHLERSQMLLTEIMGTDAESKVDISAEQEQARDLLQANRLFLQSAAKSGDPVIAHTLDDLERVLVEVANGPSELSRDDLHQIRAQIDSQSLLFRIRVLGSKARQSTRQEQVKQRL